MKLFQKSRKTVAKGLTVWVSNHYCPTLFGIRGHYESSYKSGQYVECGAPGTGFFIRTSSSHSYKSFCNAEKAKLQPSYWDLVKGKEFSFDKEISLANAALRETQNEDKVMYGREEILNELPPYQGGGEMIQDVTFEKTTYNELPFKFEAGTPSVGDVLGLGAAIDFMKGVGLDKIASHEAELLDYATRKLLKIPGLRIYGTAPHKAGVISFLVGNCNSYDVGTLLDKVGVAVRTGHHCTQPIMDRYGITGTVRASFACYTTKKDVDALVDGLNRILPLLA